jgi:hypothetical protein
MEAEVLFVSDDGSFRLDIDNSEDWWEEWMMDPDYNPSASDDSDTGELSGEDAVMAMVLDEETLYDKSGGKLQYSKTSESFMYDGVLLMTVSGLSRAPKKHTRKMTTWEAKAWANSEASRGWFVRLCPIEEWNFPQYYRYDTDLSHYRRARLLPDLSGIDESAIQGFEVEE